MQLHISLQHYVEKHFLVCPSFWPNLGQLIPDAKQRIRVDSKNTIKKKSQMHILEWRNYATQISTKKIKLPQIGTRTDE